MLPVPRDARVAFRLRFIRARGALIRDFSRDTWTDQKFEYMKYGWQQKLSAKDVEHFRFKHLFSRKNNLWNNWRN